MRSPVANLYRITPSGLVEDFIGAVNWLPLVPIPAL